MYGARVSKEVIVSAGALATPQLLMLSGLGPKQALQAQKITVVKDIPELGQKLQVRVLRVNDSTWRSTFFAFINEGSSMDCKVIIISLDFCYQCADWHHYVVNTRSMIRTQPTL